MLDGDGGGGSNGRGRLRAQVTLPDRLTVDGHDGQSYEKGAEPSRGDTAASTAAAAAATAAAPLIYDGQGQAVYRVAQLLASRPSPIPLGPRRQGREFLVRWDG